MQELSQVALSAQKDAESLSMHPEDEDEFKEMRAEAWKESLFADPPVENFIIDTHFAALYGFQFVQDFKTNIIFHVLEDCMKGNRRKYDLYPHDVQPDTFYALTRRSAILTDYIEQHLIHDDQTTKHNALLYLIHETGLADRSQEEYLLNVFKDLVGTARSMYRKNAHDELNNLLEDVDFSPLNVHEQAPEQPEDQTKIENLLSQKIQGHRILPENMELRELLNSISSTHHLSESDRELVRIAAAEYIYAEVVLQAGTYSKAQKALEILFPGVTMAYQMHTVLVNHIFQHKGYSDTD